MRPAGGSRRALAIGRIGLVLAGLLAGLALVELSLRTFLPQEIGLRWYTREGVMVYVPGLRGRYVRPEFRSRVEINSDGLRDREYRGEKEAGVYRILVLGDSLTAGLQVPAEETFCKRVEATLRAERAGARIEVVNAGISGYGTADELRYLETYGARWKPDLVLVAFFCGNDVKNNMTERALVREAGRVQIPTKPLTEWQYRVRGFRCWLASHSHFFQFLRDRLRFDGPEAPARRVSEEGGVTRAKGERAVAGVEGAATAVRDSASKVTGRSQPEGTDRSLDRLADWEILFADPGPEYADGWKLTLELLGRIDEFSRGLGARTATITIPSPWQNDPELIGAHLGPAAARGTFDALRPGRIVCEYASTISVPCTDLLPGFWAAGSDSSYYWKLDGHFTSKAHATAARLITQFLHDRQLVP